MVHSLGGIVGRGFPWKGGSLEVGLVEELVGLVEGLVGLTEVSVGLELELTGIVVTTARVAKAWQRR